MPTILDGPAWWASHKEKGTNGRPRPGTRVKITGSSPCDRQLGTVTHYEGQWNSTTFPVRIDYTGLTPLYTTGDVIELLPATVNEVATNVVPIPTATDEPEPETKSTPKRAHKRKGAA